MADERQVATPLAMVLRHTSMEDKLSSSQSNASSVAKKYRHVRFSCKKVLHLIDIIVVATKNPAENPAKTEKHELKSIHSRQGLNKKT